MDRTRSLDHPTRHVVRAQAGPYTSLQLPVIINNEEYKAVIDVGLPTSLVSTAIWQKVNSALYPLSENIITERVTRRTNLQLMGFTHFQLQVAGTVLDLEDALVYDYEEPEVFLSISAVAALGLIIDFREGTYGLRSEEGNYVDWNNDTLLTHDKKLGDYGFWMTDSMGDTRFNQPIGPPAAPRNDWRQMSGGMIPFIPSSRGPMPIGMNSLMGPAPMSSGPRGMSGQMAARGRNMQPSLRPTMGTSSQVRQRPTQMPVHNVVSFPKRSSPAGSMHSDQRQKVNDGKLNFFLKNRVVQAKTPVLKKKPRNRKKNKLNPNTPPVSGKYPTNVTQIPVQGYPGKNMFNPVQSSPVLPVSKPTGVRNDTPNQKGGNSNIKANSTPKVENAPRKFTSDTFGKPSGKQMLKQNNKNQRNDGPSKGFVDGSWIAKTPSKIGTPGQKKTLLPKNYKCGNCFSMDHTIDQCKQPIELKCVFCGRIGHLRAHCPTVIKTTPTHNAVVGSAGASSTGGVLDSTGNDSAIPKAQSESSGTVSKPQGSTGTQSSEPMTSSTESSNTISKTQSSSDCASSIPEILIASSPCLPVKRPASSPGQVDVKKVMKEPVAESPADISTTPGPRKKLVKKIVKRIVKKQPGSPIASCLNDNDNPASVPELDDPTFKNPVSKMVDQLPKTAIKLNMLSTSNGSSNPVEEPASVTE